jgi:hypothetical protein
MENIADDPHNTGLDVGGVQEEAADNNAGTAAAPALEPEQPTEEES